MDKLSMALCALSKFGDFISIAKSMKVGSVSTNILTIVGDDIAKVIIEQAQAFDLVVLRSVRYRTAGGLAVSEVTTQVINNLKCSIVMLGEPQ